MCLAFIFQDVLSTYHQVTSSFDSSSLFSVSPKSPFERKIRCNCYYFQPPSLEISQLWYHYHFLHRHEQVWWFYIHYCRSYQLIFKLFPLAHSYAGICRVQWEGTPDREGCGMEILSLFVASTLEGSFPSLKMRIVFCICVLYSCPIGTIHLGHNEQPERDLRTQQDLRIAYFQTFQSCSWTDGHWN